MSFLTTDPIAHWSGNDVTTEFSFLHKYYDDGDIVVILRSAAGIETIQTITTHYTLAGKVTDPVDTTTCTVTMVTAPATGERLSVYRKRDLVQALSIILQDGWRSEDMEEQLDFIVMMIQFLQIQVDKSLKIPYSDLGARIVTLPTETLRANKAPIFDENGDVDIGGAIAIPEASIADINADTANKYTTPEKLAGSKYAAGLKGDFTIVLDGGGSVLTTGVKKILKSIPYSGTITAARLIADQSGAIVVDVWKTSYADYDAGATHPVDGDSITASAPPTIAASGVKSEDTTLTGWTTSVTKGDIIWINIDSITSITKVTLELDIDKTGA
jgi:hypothetical protein